MRMLSRALLSALLCVATIAPAYADQIIIWPGQGAVSTEPNQQARFTSLAFGTWIRDVLGSNVAAGGTYSDLSVAPQTGLDVVVQPSLPNQPGSLYQLVQNDPTPLPPSTTPNLPADTELTVVQALQKTVSAPLGPLSPPGTAGQSIYYLIEAQVQKVDTTPVSLVFTNTDLTQTMQTVTTQRLNEVVVQTKAGTAATTPTSPTVDAGWIPIAYALIPYGTITVTSGMITMAPSYQGSSVLPATGVATSTTSYGSQSLTLQQNVWNNVPQTNTWSIGMDNSLAFGNLQFYYNFNTLGMRLSKTGTTAVSKFVVIGNLGGSPEHTSPSCGFGDVCSAESATAGRLWLGGETTQAALDFGNANSGQFTFGATANAPVLQTTTASGGSLFLGGTTGNGRFEAGVASGGPYIGYSGTGSNSTKVNVFAHGTASSATQVFGGDGTIQGSIAGAGASTYVAPVFLGGNLSAQAVAGTYHKVTGTFTYSTSVPVIAPTFSGAADAACFFIDETSGATSGAAVTAGGSMAAPTGGFTSGHTYWYSCEGF